MIDFFAVVKKIIKEEQIATWILIVLGRIKAGIEIIVIVHHAVSEDCSESKLKYRVRAVSVPHSLMGMPVLLEIQSR